MAVYFVDSSALVKRYVQEAGTSWVRSLTHRGAANLIYLARITAVEVTSAVARSRKGRTLTSPRASSILYRFRKHFAGRYLVVDATPALLDHAMRLANAQALSGLRRGAARSGSRSQPRPSSGGVQLCHPGFV